MRKNIAIIGYGYVGKAMEKFFSSHYDIKVYDPYYMDANEMSVELQDDNIFFTRIKNTINKCDLAVICVPTPMMDDGKCDTSIVEETFEWLDVPLTLIKSTVLPGTTNMLQDKYPELSIAFSPEYIGEGKYEVQWWKDKGYPHPTDMKKHDFVIIGGERPITSKILEFFKKVVGPDVKYVQTDSTTAELTKYMENSWGATKVIFCNEFAKMAGAFGVDYNELRELFLLDGRTERMHTLVFEDNKGFGGKCFPKDVNGIVKASERAGYKPGLLKQVLKSNDEIRKENK